MATSAAAERENLLDTLRSALASLEASEAEKQKLVRAVA